MSTLIPDLISLLGKGSEDPEVARVIDKHQLNDVFDDPPLWRYVGSKSKGADLLFEEETVVDVQIHVQATKLHDAIPEELPFGLRKEMTQRQVHEALGNPLAADDHDSRYQMADPKVRLVVSFDASGVVRYLSVAPPNR